MRRLCFPLCLVLALAACATPDIDKSYRLNPSGKEGIAAGSITYSGRFSGYRVQYRQIPEGAKGYFEFGAGNMLIPYIPRGDFKERHLRGAGFAAALPAGEYEIFRWSVSSGAAYVVSTEPFSFRFRVEPGKAVYLGNFHFTVTSTLGLTVTGATLSLRDEIARDLPILKAKFPALADVELAYAIAPGTTVGHVGGAPATTFTPIYIPILR